MESGSLLQTASDTSQILTVASNFYNNIVMNDRVCSKGTVEVRSPNKPDWDIARETGFN